MKFFLSALILLTCYSCRNKTADKEVLSPKVNTPTPAKADTFNLRDLDSDPALQPEILLDSIDIPESKKHLGISIIYPKLSPVEFPLINKWVKYLIKEKKNDFYEQIIDEKVVYDTGALSPQGYYMWMRPQLLYLTKKAVSFVIEHGSGFRANSPWFEYCVMNFDLERKREINLRDYFLLKTNADSSFLEKIISRAVEVDFNIRNYKEDELKFAFDSSSIYFLFEKYHPLAWGTFSVEKKYIIDHINPLYR